MVWHLEQPNECTPCPVSSRRINSRSLLSAFAAPAKPDRRFATQVAPISDGGLFVGDLGDVTQSQVAVSDPNAPDLFQCREGAEPVVFGASSPATEQERSTMIRTTSLIHFSIRAAGLLAAMLQRM